MVFIATKNILYHKEILSGQKNIIHIFSCLFFNISFLNTSLIYSMKQFMRIPLFVFIFLGLSTLCVAQPGDDDPNEKERLEALRIAFITKRLSLTPDEAQKFWPVYNQYNSELESSRKDSKIIRKGMSDDFQSMTDPEVEAFVDEVIAQKQKEVDIVKKYHIQFKKTLPIRKVALLYKSERDFRKQLLNEFRTRQGVGVRAGKPGNKP